MAPASVPPLGGSLIWQGIPSRSATSTSARTIFCDTMKLPSATVIAGPFPWPEGWLGPVTLSGGPSHPFAPSRRGGFRARRYRAGLPSTSLSPPGPPSASLSPPGPPAACPSRQALPAVSPFQAVPSAAAYLSPPGPPAAFPSRQALPAVWPFQVVPSAAGCLSPPAPPSASLSPAASPSA